MSLQVVVGDLFIAVGAFLMVVAGIGLLRLPDVYNRANAVAKAAGLGLVSVLLGVVVLTPSVPGMVTLLVAVAVQLFTVPIASYKIGEAAYLSGAPMVPGTRRDDERDDEAASGGSAGGPHDAHPPG